MGDAAVTPAVCETLAGQARRRASAPEFDRVEIGRRHAIDKNAVGSQDMLRRVVALARKRRVKVALTVVPHLEQFQGQCSLLPNEAIHNLAEDTGTPYLDSWAALNATLGGREATDWYIPGDMHFSVAGYQAWAEAHIAFLLNPKSALLPL